MISQDFTENVFMQEAEDKCDDVSFTLVGFGSSNRGPDDDELAGLYRGENERWLIAVKGFNGESGAIPCIPCGRSSWRPMLAPWDKTLPATGLVSPTSAFSSFLIFSLVRVGSGMPDTGWRWETHTDCGNVARQESVERCKKVRLSNVARVERW